MADRATRPNVVVVFVDDLGYGDLGCFGATDVRTPNLDRMASEGAKYTSFNVGAPVCTPSRAALLTGCYPRRVGLSEGVLFPGDSEGLAPRETTAADVLSDAGYATTCIGKWHLGDREPFLPTNHGFDSYFGIPYSNDMRPDNMHGVDKHPPLPILRDEEVVERGPDQRTLTRRYTEEAVAFIEEHAGDEPFFCYLPHTMPHVPLYASEEFEDTSARGLFGDVVEELDWSVGRILDALAAADVDEETLVLFTSDNGPWLEMGSSSGSAGPLRGGKFELWEGGVRMPTIARWPGTIPAGTTCTGLMTAMDLLPTLASLAGSDLPERTIDGEDASALLSDPEGATSPHDYYAYHDAEGDLGAIRDSAGNKLHLDDELLYDLRTDVGERRDVSDENPDTVERLREAAREIDAELAANARPVGRVEED